MTEPTAADIAALRGPEGRAPADPKTGRKLGNTPVNIAVHGQRTYVRTPGKASKNKRLRNFPEARFAPCTWLGRPTGTPVQAATRLLAGDASAAAARLINRKHPVLQGIIVPLTHRHLRTETLHCELSEVRELEDQ